MTPIRRLMDAWLSTNMSLGRFLDNAVAMSGRRLRMLNEEQLADAAEEYVKWLQNYGHQIRKNCAPSYCELGAYDPDGETS